MSNVSGFESIYIRDLDAYIPIDAICVANAKETEDGALRQELERIGAIDLLADKSLSPHALHAHHISPEEWRWEVYRASRSLRTQKSWRTLEP